MFQEALADKERERAWDLCVGSLKLRKNLRREENLGPVRKKYLGELKTRPEQDGQETWTQ